MNLDPVRTGTRPFIFLQSAKLQTTKILTVVKGMHFEVVAYVVSHFKKLYFKSENIFNLDM